MVVAEAKLIRGNWQEDDLGQEYCDMETGTNVLVEVDNIGMNEFAKVGQMNITPEVKLITQGCNYNKEKYVEFDGERYSIYRTFTLTDGRIELYLTKKVGV